MEYLYVGDSKNIASRIKTRHCSGNVKKSALRRHVADKIGFEVVKKPKISRFGREYQEIYISAPNRREAEKQVSAYIATGRWKFVECTSKDEAEDFQYYVIEKIIPVLNVLRYDYDHKNIDRYKELLKRLNSCPWTDKKGGLFPCTPGVYVFGNDTMPVKL
jgi:hypothetical protein